LGIIEGDSGLTKAAAILEFCKAPRTRYEIVDFLGKRMAAFVKSAYIDPLIENGKLKIISHPSNKKQIFLNSEIDVFTVSDTAIFEFCRTPRMKGEIGRHFGLSYFQTRKILTPLIESGKLIGDTPNSPQNKWQKFIFSE